MTATGEKNRKHKGCFHAEKLQRASASENVDDSERLLKSRQRAISRAFSLLQKMATKLSKDTTEILIAIVSQNRFVFDPKERDHKDSQMFANFWSSVAKKLNVPGLAFKNLQCIMPSMYLDLLLETCSE